MKAWINMYAPILFLWWMVGLPFVYLAISFSKHTGYASITNAVFMVYFVPVMLCSIFAPTTYGKRRTRR